MSGLMNGSVRLVVLQFSFSNLKLIPSQIRQNSQKPPSKFADSKPGVSGEQILNPIENVGGLPFRLDLAKAGYVLVDAFSRIDQKNGQPFGIVRFVFAHHSHATSSKEFLKVRGAADDALCELLEQAMWRVRGFLNHFFEDGVIVDNTYVVSINLEARSPLFDGNGNRLTRWKKDEHNERIGDAPVPLEPVRFLRITDGDIAVTE